VDNVKKISALNANQNHITWVKHVINIKNIRLQGSVDIAMKN